MNNYAKFTVVIVSVIILIWAGIVAMGTSHNRTCGLLIKNDTDSPISVDVYSTKGHRSRLLDTYSEIPPKGYAYGKYKYSPGVYTLQAVNLIIEEIFYEDYELLMVVGSAFIEIKVTRDMTISCRQPDEGVGTCLLLEIDKEDFGRFKIK